MMRRRNQKKAAPTFNLRCHAPKFTAKEHEEARAHGYKDAAEQWAVNMEIKMDDDYRRRVREQAGGATRASLESVGTPYERLGALSDAANNLPDLPTFVEPEVQVPKKEYQRRAAVHGLRNRLVRWSEACERDGIAHDAELCPEEMEFGDYMHRQRQGQDIRQRLDAMGENFDEELGEVESGATTYNERFDEELESNDPEIRRVHDEYKKFNESHGGDAGWSQTWEVENNE